MTGSFGIQTFRLLSLYYSESARVPKLAYSVSSVFETESEISSPGFQSNITCIRTFLAHKE